MSRARHIAEVSSLLRSLGHEAALVGGIAVSVRVRERFTRDVDFAVAVGSEDEAEALAFAMQRRGFVLRTVVEQEAKGVLATLRFHAPAGATEMLDVDLLCASCGIEPEIVASAVPLEIERGIWVPVATTPYLIAMKVLAVQEARDQDAGDLRALLAVASERELKAARKALRLIEKRGFERGKQLLHELRKFVPPDR